MNRTTEKVILAAYYYPATRAQKAAGTPGTLHFETLENGLRTSRITRHANSKREARSLAIAHGATPWNF